MKRSLPLLVCIISVFTVLANGLTPQEHLIKLNRGIGKLEVNPATGTPYHFTPIKPFPAPTKNSDIYDHLSHFFAEFDFFRYDPLLVPKDFDLLRIQSDTHLDNHTVLEFRQTHQSIPIYGSSFKVHLDNMKRISAVDGSLISPVELASSILPFDHPISLEMAESIIKRHFINEHSPSPSPSPSSTPMDWTVLGSVDAVIYRVGLFDGIPGENVLAWTCVVVPATAASQPREETVEFDKYRVFVRQDNGEVIAKERLSHSALSRESWKGVYNQGNKPYWKEGLTYPTPNEDANTNIEVSKYIYATFKNALGIKSYNNQDAKMTHVFHMQDSTNTSSASTIDTTASRCPNAVWDADNRILLVCDGLAVTDVIGHEWGHGYIQFSAALTYQGQSGALSEAYADITGESIQLFWKDNSKPTGANSQYRIRNDPNSCNPLGVTSTSTSSSTVPANFNSYRWIIGEEIAIGGYEGGIRDMYNPNCFNQPKAVNDWDFVLCNPSLDRGGVHANSGIATHAYALLVDGCNTTSTSTSTSSDLTATCQIEGIGLTKSFHIFMRALFQHLTSSATFTQLATALENSCDTLQSSAVHLKDPLTGTSTNLVITQNDCNQLRAVLDRTGMALPFCVDGPKSTNGTSEPHIYKGFPPVGYVMTGTDSSSSSSSSTTTTRTTTTTSTTTTVYLVSLPFTLPKQSEFHPTCRIQFSQSTSSSSSSILMTEDYPGQVYYSDSLYLFACPVPPLKKGMAREVVFRVSADGSTFSPETFAFLYIDAPYPMEISPSSGPMDKSTMVTITGVNFAEFSGCNIFTDTRDPNGEFVDCLACLFGQVQVESPVRAQLRRVGQNQQEILCRVPNWAEFAQPQEVLSVGVATNGQIFVNNPSLTFTFLNQTQQQQTGSGVVTSHEDNNNSNSGNDDSSEDSSFNSNSSAVLSAPSFWIVCSLTVLMVLLINHQLFRQ